MTRATSLAARLALGLLLLAGCERAPMAPAPDPEIIYLASGLPCRRGAPCDPEAAWRAEAVELWPHITWDWDPAANCYRTDEE